MARHNRASPGPNLAIAALLLLLAAAAPLLVWGRNIDTPRRLQDDLPLGDSSGSTDDLRTEGGETFWDGLSDDDLNEIKDDDRPEGAAKFTASVPPESCLDKSKAKPPAESTCRTFLEPRNVWLYGMATDAIVGPGDGTYFFVVVEPDGDKALDNLLPDGSLPPTCLSTTPRAARAFRIQGGVISKVNAGTTHRLQNGKVELFPFKAVTNRKGRYELLVCPLPNDVNAPVKPSDCKSDTFYITRPGSCVVRIRVHKRPENTVVSPFGPDALEVFTDLVNAFRRGGVRADRAATRAITCAADDPWRCSTRLQALLVTPSGFDAGQLLAALRESQDKWVRMWGKEPSLGLNCLDDIVLDSANANGPYCAAETADIPSVASANSFTIFTGINDGRTYTRTTPFIHFDATFAVRNQAGISNATVQRTLLFNTATLPSPWFGCRTSRAEVAKPQPSPPTVGSHCALSLNWKKDSTSTLSAIDSPTNVLTALPAFSAAAQSAYTTGGAAPAYLGCTTSRVTNSTPTLPMFSTAVFASDALAKAASDILFNTAGGWIRTYAQTYNFTCYDGVIIESFPNNCAGPRRAIGGAGGLIAWQAATNLGSDVTVENYSNAVGCKLPVCNVQLHFRRLRRVPLTDGPPRSVTKPFLFFPFLNSGTPAGLSPDFKTGAQVKGGANGLNVQQSFPFPLPRFPPPPEPANPNLLSTGFLARPFASPRTCPLGLANNPALPCALTENLVLVIPFVTAGADTRAAAVMAYIRASALSSVGSTAPWITNRVLPLGISAQPASQTLAGFDCFDSVTLENSPPLCAGVAGTVWTGVLGDARSTNAASYPGLNLEVVSGYEYVDWTSALRRASPDCSSVTASI